MKKRYERYYTTRQPGPKWSGAVTSENWKKTVLAAIRMLPLDIRLEVRHAITSDDSMIVTVARDSQSDDDWDDDGDDGEIEIRYWNTFRELGWPPESDGSYGPGGFDEKVADWPIISFNSTAQDPSRSLYANQASASDLIVEVQEAILEQMYDLGHVFKDAKGRFIRMIEPRKILGWQWTR